jgi:hypothetical protein
MAKSKQQGQTGRAGHSQHKAPHVRAPAPRARRPGVPNSQRPQREPRIVYSDDLAAKLCEHIADGLSLKEACQLPGMPSRSTAYKWLSEYAFFSDVYARAREERADLIADEIVTIADSDPDPNRARVRIDARKWWAAKVNPKKYGDRLVTENTNTNYTISDKPMNKDEWREAYGVETPGGASTVAH